MYILQSMQETLKLRQANLESVNAVYRTMVSESTALSAPVPDDIKTKMTQLNSDWLKVQELSTQVKSIADVSITMDTSGAPPEDTVDAVMKMEGEFFKLNLF